WYLLGLIHKHRVITTYALDRIIHTKTAPGIDYITNDIFDPIVYFKNTIGITYHGESPLRVTLFVDNIFVPYLLTLPLHSSQSLIKRTDEGALFQLEVIHNPEFETLILGYAGLISIVGPEELRIHFINKLDQAKKRYKENDYFRESMPE
ncbi:MAG TPA: WYL domain-containing protein, partial [Sphingobacteriaceae bacterium]|nr:WYL domain-containing protein [Sphingobacteriaceae bacterium]